MDSVVALVGLGRAATRRATLGFGVLAPLVLAVASATVAIVYFANRPALDRFPDTVQYEAGADHLPGSFLSTGRLPGYPLVLAVSSFLPGGREVGLVLVQVVMFAGAVLLTYAIARAALRRPWMAFLVSLPVATDLLLAGFTRTGTTEMLALLLVSGVLVAAVRFIDGRRLRDLWLAAALAVVLAFTRQEWAFLAVPLVAYALVVMARRRRLDRTIVVHAVAATAVVVGSVAAYSVGNWAVNGYLGTSSIINIGLMGKVMVYGLQDDVPPQYGPLVPLVDRYAPAKGPWQLILVPPFDDRNHQLAGEYARAVIAREPVTFGLLTLDLAVNATTEYDPEFLLIRDTGPFSSSLRRLAEIDARRYAALVLVPALCLTWLVAGLARGADRGAQVMGVVAVVVVYGTIVVAGGTYDEFGRIHVPFNPAATLVVLGTVLLNLEQAWRRRGASSLLLLSLVAVEVAAVLAVPRWTPAGPKLLALVVIALLQTWAVLWWQRRAGAPESPQIRSQASPTAT